MATETSAEGSPDPVELREFVQPGIDGSDDVVEAKTLARLLKERLNAPGVLRRLVDSNRPEFSSASVQAVISPEAIALGFKEEPVGLSDVSGFRPDFYRTLADGSLILFEVERGKTTTNNMDLLDLWKCHVCPGAKHLFLFVPRLLRHNPGMTPKKEFAAVSRRLGMFFRPGFTTNVRGLFLFGY